jgi:chemotaxis protein CheZ
MAEVLDKKLHSEVLNLIQYIQRLRQELAGIAQNKGDQTTIEGMADRLDAIVASTAEATETILAAMESLDGLIDKIRAHPEAAELDALCDQMADKAMAAMEACSFQDLTGQRVSKVIGSLRFVEERVNAMADICGQNEIAQIDEYVDAPTQTDDGVALEGPQRPGDAISQDDIDQLFA